MIKLFGEGFSNAERVGFRSAIYLNVFDSLFSLLSEIEKRGSSDDFHLSEKAIAARLRLEAAGITTTSALSPEIASELSIIWSDSAVQKMYSKRSELQILESVEYFMNKIDLISKEGYIPDQADIVRVRIRTTGVIRHNFELQDLKFQLIDVGGQRNERRKWIHHFDGVTSVFFITAISEYDQVCWEDRKTNRVTESMNLFSETINSDSFKDTSIILFLNKRDLFDQKFQHVPLSSHFQDWNGNSKEEAYEFLKEKFLSLSETPRDIFVHFTNATDPENITRVFNAVRNIIVKGHVEENAFL